MPSRSLVPVWRSKSSSINGSIAVYPWIAVVDCCIASETTHDYNSDSRRAYRSEHLAKSSSDITRAGNKCAFVSCPAQILPSALLQLSERLRFQFGVQACRAHEREAFSHFLRCKGKVDLNGAPHYSSSSLSGDGAGRSETLR